MHPRDVNKSAITVSCVTKVLFSQRKCFHSDESVASRKFLCYESFTSLASRKSSVTKVLAPRTFRVLALLGHACSKRRKSSAFERHDHGTTAHGTSRYVVRGDADSRQRR